MNIEFPQTGVSCFQCEKASFISYTPSGADYETCPICGTVSSNYVETDDKFFIFCKHCQTIYMISDCIHAENGCTDSAYYGKLVRGFVHDNNEYNGMPKFSSYKQCVDTIREYKLKWVCLCNDKCPDCPKAYYPKLGKECHCHS